MNAQYSFYWLKKFKGFLFNVLIKKQLWLKIAGTYFEHMDAVTKKHCSVPFDFFFLIVFFAEILLDKTLK